MKPQVLKTRLGKSLSVFLVLSACSTYRTFDPRADQAQAGQLDQQHQIQSTTTTQAPAFSTYKDETANQYGEPYFLPKGLIHLVIKPEAGSGGSASSGTSGTPPANSNVITITSGTTTQTTGATQQQTLDDGLQPVAYQISVDSVMVPDLTTGPYFAHYEQNWFYSENIALGVTADGLLSTVSGTSTDKTPQIISNLVDTGIDLAEFAAQVGSFTAAAAPGGGGTTMNYANQVRYKRLNIDVTFDPFDPDQVENVGKLFHTVVAVDPGVTVGGTTYLVSPFTFAVNTIRTPELATSEEKLGTGQGKVSKPNADGSFRLTPKIPARNQQGLWFREMTPVEILLKQNPEEFRVNAKAVLEFNESNLAQNSDDTLNPQTAASQLQKAQQKESDAKDNLTRLNAILTALTNGKITSPLPTPKDLTDANDAINKAQESVSTAHDDVIAKQANSNLATAIDNLRKAFAAAPTISRTARFVKSVPNPERVFAFNISRSAFVTNKITTLTISNGVLTQFALNKPSEAEGFSEIPLNIAQKLLQLPSSLLTIRTQRVQAQNSLVGAQTNLVNSQSQLLSADQQAQQNIGQLNAQAASVNAQTSLLQSQTNLLNQQQALKQAQAGH